GPPLHRRKNGRQVASPLPDGNIFTTQRRCQRSSKSTQLDGVASASRIVLQTNNIISDRSYRRNIHSNVARHSVRKPLKDSTRLAPLIVSSINSESIIHIVHVANTVRRTTIRDDTRPPCLSQVRPHLIIHGLVNHRVRILRTRRRFILSRNKR